MLFFCFHHVEPVPRIKFRTPYTITPLGLKTLIITLRLIGMKIVSLKEVLDNPSPEVLNDHRLCVLTFDDGYDSLREHGLPVLVEQNCPATVFVLGGKFSASNDWDPVDFEGQAPDPLLSLEQMREMGETGLIHYGSHGLLHKNMTTLEPETLEGEILQSYKILSEALPEYFLPVFAYPWGRYNEQAQEVLRQSKYAFAYTTERGKQTDGTNRFAVPRHDINFNFSNPIYMLLRLIQYQIGIFDCSFLFEVPRALFPGRRKQANNEVFSASESNAH